LGLAPGYYTVEAGKEGYKPYSKRVFIDGENAVEVVLEPVSIEDVNVVFVIDTRKAVPAADFEYVKKEFLSASKEIFSRAKNARVYVIEQNTNLSSYSEYSKGKSFCKNYTEAEKLFSGLSQKDEEIFGEFCVISDAVRYVYDNTGTSRKTFVFSMFNEKGAYYRGGDGYEIKKRLKDKNISVSIVADISDKYTKGYALELIKDTGGVNIGISGGKTDIKSAMVKKVFG
jgi:hypothetical protein